MAKKKKDLEPIPLNWEEAFEEELASGLITPAQANFENEVFLTDKDLESDTTTTIVEEPSYRSSNKKSAISQKDKAPLEKNSPSEKNSLEENSPSEKNSATPELDLVPLSWEDLFDDEELEQGIVKDEENLETQETSTTQQDLGAQEKFGETKQKEKNRAKKDLFLKENLAQVPAELDLENGVLELDSEDLAPEKLDSVEKENNKIKLSTNKKESAQKDLDLQNIEDSGSELDSSFDLMAEDSAFDLMAEDSVFDLDDAGEEEQDMNLDDESVFELEAKAEALAEKGATENSGMELELDEIEEPVSKVTDSGEEDSDIEMEMDLELDESEERTFEPNGLGEDDCGIDLKETPELQKSAQKEEEIEDDENDAGLPAFAMPSFAMQDEDDEKEAKQKLPLQELDLETKNLCAVQTHSIEDRGALLAETQTQAVIELEESDCAYAYRRPVLCLSEADTIADTRVIRLYAKDLSYNHRVVRELDADFFARHDIFVDECGVIVLKERDMAEGNESTEEQGPTDRKSRRNRSREVAKADGGPNPITVWSLRILIFCLLVTPPGFHFFASNFVMIKTETYERDMSAFSGVSSLIDQFNYFKGHRPPEGSFNWMGRQVVTKEAYEQLQKKHGSFTWVFYREGSKGNSWSDILRFENNKDDSHGQEDYEDEYESSSGQ